MKIAVVHGEVAAGAGRDEQDVLAQVDCVSRGLTALGHEAVAVPASINLDALARALADIRPVKVFNLVETLAGRGALIHLVPSLLDALKVPYTGAGADAMFLTSNKILAKRLLAAAGLPTPGWLSAADRQGTLPIDGAWLVKSVWEHASIGLDEDSVLLATDQTRLFAEMDARREALGGACFAEAYVDGREFNLSILDGPEGPQALPPAEIRFDAYPPGKVRVVGYRSKWEEESFEFVNTPRTFDFSDEDALLLAHLQEMALRCWNLFDLRGYARVDFRVDRQGRPWILEINANPCLSPDAGFPAACHRVGLSFTDLLNRILHTGDRRPA